MYSVDGTSRRHRRRTRGADRLIAFVIAADSTSNPRVSARIPAPAPAPASRVNIVGTREGAKSQKVKESKRQGASLVSRYRRFLLLGDSQYHARFPPPLASGEWSTTHAGVDARYRVVKGACLSFAFSVFSLPAKQRICIVHTVILEHDFCVCAAMCPHTVRPVHGFYFISFFKPALCLALASPYILGMHGLLPPLTRLFPLASPDLSH